MKYFRYILTMFFCIIAINVYAATSNFEPTINMEPDITENQISIIVGYKGENIMAVTQTISYEEDYLSLVDVTMMDNFVVTKGNEKKDSSFQTLKILADSDYAFEDINYAVLTFELKDKFKVGKSSKVFMYSYEAIGPNKDKYRHKGYEMTLRRDEVGQMAFLLKIIDSSTKREYWLSQNYLIIIAAVLGIGGIIAMIFMIPTKRKREKRAEKIHKEMVEGKNPEKKSIDPIKIDYDMIEDLGTVKKEVDMSQAIEVSDLKPFGETEGKFVSSEMVKATSQVQQMPQTPVITQDAFNAVGNGDSSIVEEAPINAFNMTIDSGLANKNQESRQENEQNVVTPMMEVRLNPQVISNQGDNQAVNSNSSFKEIPEEKKEDLILFQPTFGDENAEDGTSNNGNIPPLSIILVLILSLSLLVPHVMAIEYRVSELRDCIVGNIPYDAELDYNNDGKVDIADIIETKDLSNTILGDDKPSHNFKPVESEGVHVTDPTTTIVTSREPTTTTKKGVFNINTTPKRTTSKGTTTKKTTTKKTTTSRTTTTKTTATKYTVTLNTNNSKADRNSVIVVSGKTATFKVTPNVGYTYDSVSCGNGASVTYSKSTKKLEVKSVNANMSCTINFKERDDMKLTVTASHGKVSPSTVKGAYKASVSSKVTPSNGYQYKSHSCTNGLNATYDEASGTLTVKSLIDDGSCKVIFEEKTYQMTIKVSGIEKKYNSKYNQKTSFSIESNKVYKKLKCNNLSKNFTTTNVSSSIIKYTFEMALTKDTVCEYS
ncbi:MAG: hypothetical protein K2G03_01555 [Bacilli bacterium]|nr:hypothetical protein [Bacilli bacterium]